MFGDTAYPAFYKQFAQSGISRSLTVGLAKELRDSGIDLKNGAIDLANAIKDNPGAALNAVWNALKGLPQGIVDAFKEAGTAIGEGAAVALNDDIQAKLNAIYGADVASAQHTILAIGPRSPPPPYLKSRHPERQQFTTLLGTKVRVTQIC